MTNSNTPTPIEKLNGKRLDAKTLYVLALACSGNQLVYIGMGSRQKGIKDGRNALMNMDSQIIKDTENDWEFRVTDKCPGESWVSGDEFWEALESRGISRQWFR